MSTTRKWTSYGTPQLKKVMRSMRKSHQDGSETKFTSEDASEIYNTLSKRNKTDSWMADFVIEFSGGEPEEQSQNQQNEEPPKPEQQPEQQPEQTERQPPKPEEDEVYYPHLESPIQQEDISEPKEDKQPDENVEQPDEKVEQPAKTRKRKDRQGVRFDNPRAIEKGDTVEFQGSAKLGKEIVQGTVVGFTKGAHPDQIYCQIVVERNGKKVRAAKRDYACKLIISDEEE